MKKNFYQNIILSSDIRMKKIVENNQVSLFGIAIIGPDKQKYLSTNSDYFLINQINVCFEPQYMFWSV